VKRFLVEVLSFTVGTTAVFAILIGFYLMLWFAFGDVVRALMVP